MSKLEAPHTVMKQTAALVTGLYQKLHDRIAVDSRQSFGGPDRIPFDQQMQHISTLISTQNAHGGFFPVGDGSARMSLPSSRSHSGGTRPGVFPCGR